jgi:flagellar hook-basal body complex protein FliE
MADLRGIQAAAAGASSTIAPVRFPQLERGAEPFGATLGRAVAGLEALQSEARDATMAVAAGKSVDTAQAVAQIEKANIAFTFALSIRNKLLEAYQDVMRMPV